jgi:hypothetical protein
MPAVGDQLDINGVQLTVGRLARRRVDRVGLRVRDEPAGGAAP